MRGVDAKVLVRFLVRDDPQQTPIAQKVFTTEFSRADPGFISLIVLCETAWVLTRAYGYKKPVVVEVISRILNAEELVVENAHGVEIALELYNTKPIGFSDAVVAVHNHMQGCTTTVTFDRNLGETEFAQLLR